MLKTLFYLYFYSLFFVVSVLLLPGNILLDIEPKDYSLPLPEKLTGPLEPNERLADMTKLFEDKLFGPESIAEYQGKLVTGSTDGYLYEIVGNNMRPVLKLVEKSCAANPHNITRCGRPLGLRFDSKGTLFVVEVGVGVFTVKDIFGKSPKVELVFDIDETSALGQTSKFINDLAIDEGTGLNGGPVLYISDLSVKFSYSEAAYLFLGSDMGRVIKYDINAKKVESIAENLLAPNGLQITDDKNAILVNEFLRRQILKIYIKGPKKGRTEVLISGLPGEPDNIRRSASKTETYWVGLFNPRTNSKTNKLDYYLARPMLRKLMCRVTHLFGTTIEWIGSFFSISLVKDFGYEMKNGKPLFPILMNDESIDYAMIIEIDKNGNIVDSLQATDPSLSIISEVCEVRVNDQDTILNIVSPKASFLGKLKHKRHQ